MPNGAAPEHNITNIATPRQPPVRSASNRRSVEPEFHLFRSSIAIMGGEHHHSPEAMPKKDQDLELLKKEHVPLPFRDNCAHLVVPLNHCRRETFFNPDACTHQRHIYEECEYIAWQKRVEAKKALRKKSS